MSQLYSGEVLDPCEGNSYWLARGKLQVLLGGIGSRQLV